MRIALLGPVEVSQAERRIRLSGSKQLALLAILALNAGRRLTSMTSGGAAPARSDLSCDAVMDFSMIILLSVMARST